MSRPLLLDLFCGAGGAAMGYHRAGFDVVGVDIKPQPHYPFEFIQADVMDFMVNESVWAPSGHRIDVFHASPPCQRYIRGGTVDKGRHPDLVPAIRGRLERLWQSPPYVIENVPGAPMRPDVQLCGSMFGLAVRRHRWFESNMSLSPLVSPCDHSRPAAGVYGNPHGERGAWPGMLPSDLATWSRVMGIDWMTTDELVDAIPPAYTEFIGRALLDVMEHVA
jgi:DNA (cytosine-5)-methyltransferase 1